MSVAGIVIGAVALGLLLVLGLGFGLWAWLTRDEGDPRR